MKQTIYFLIVLFGCTSAAQKGIEVIDAKKLIELQEKGIVVVDIRTKKEYDQGHIPGVEWIDFFSDDFLIQMKKKDLKEPIIIHCAVGGRSAKAANMLKEAGFSVIYDYKGGFADWQSKGLEIE